MSEKEKATQIGEAVQLLGEQKRDLAHLAEKIEKVREAYRTFADQFERWCLSSVHGGEVFLAHPSPAERHMPAYVLGMPELAALVQEHRDAVNAVMATKAKLAGFGISL